MIGNHLEPFKFWCQKVLPNVYDDSLSYYEYLCKLNEYLNEVIGQINTLTDNMEDYEADLTATWLETKNYIDNYFNNLDVQQEINNKLDAMAQSGELSTLLAPIVGTQIGGVVAEQIGGTVANQIDNVVANQIGGSVASQIDDIAPSIITGWLNTNVDPVGSAVVVDDTLSIGGAAADAEVTGNKAKARTYHGFEPIALTSGANIALGSYSEGDTVDLTPESNANWQYAIISCNANDEFILNASGGNNPRCYALLDNSDKLILKASADYTANNLHIYVPHNGKKLIINNAKTNKKDNLYKTDFNVDTANSYSYLGYELINTNKGESINCGGDPGTVINPTPTINLTTMNQYESTVFNCKNGDMFLLNCLGSQNANCCVFLDSDNKKLGEYYMNNKVGIVVAPINSAKVIINNRIMDNKARSYYLSLDNVNNIKNRMIEIKGIGTHSQVGSKITGVGDFYYHSGERKFKVVTSYTDSSTFTDATIPYQLNGFIIYQNNIGYMDGSSFVTIIDNNIANIIYICGYGTKSGGNSGITGVGQYYIHSSENKLKKCVSFTSSTDFTDITLSFNTASIYVMPNGDWLYYTGSGEYSGLSLLRSGSKIVRQETLDSYVYQIKNVIDYLGANNFLNRKLTIAEPNGYNSWGIIANVSNTLVCCYARGTSHTDSHSGTYYKTSPDGIVWSAETVLLDDVNKRQNATGKGHDSNGNALFWIREGSTFYLYKFDGKNWTKISTVNMGAFAHVGDIISANNVMISFYNTYGNTRTYGILKSTDDGITWTITPLEQNASPDVVPTETQGVYLGNNKILAIGRKDTNSGVVAQMQLQSDDNGVTWTKEYTNITDISASTASLIIDNNTIWNYYYNRSNGKLQLRVDSVDDVWDNPTNWSNPTTILTGGTQEHAGNVNTQLLNNKHYIEYYSGNQYATGVYDYIRNPN